MRLTPLTRCYSVCLIGTLESPRFLISTDRADEAYAILQKYHGEGDNGREFVRLEFAQIQSTIAQEKETAKAFVWADVYRCVDNYLYLLSNGYLPLL